MFMKIPSSKSCQNGIRESGAGFTLVEIIIAISILAVGVILVYGAFSHVVMVTHDFSARFTAAYLTQEGLEIIRNLRDNNFIAIANNPLNPLLSWSMGLTGSPCDTGCMADYKTVTTAQLASYSGAFLALNTDGFYSYDAGATATKFKRKITITPVTGNTDVLHINVLVTWDYNGKAFSFEASEYLYNWY